MCHGFVAPPRIYDPGGLTHISENLWRRISASENLVVHEVKIRYLENNSWARPVILDDLEDRKFQDSIGIVVGVANVVFVLALAIGTLLDVRAWSQGREAELSEERTTSARCKPYGS